jgi:hypothetical protein
MIWELPSDELVIFLDFSFLSKLRGLFSSMEVMMSSILQWLIFLIILSFTVTLDRFITFPN